MNNLKEVLEQQFEAASFDVSTIEKEIASLKQQSKQMIASAIKKRKLYVSILNDIEAKIKKLEE